MRRVLPLLLCLSLWLLLLAPAVLAAPAAPATEGRRVALVIGNGAYKAGPLKNPANDARDMAAALKGAGFEVILRENAGLRQMNEAIDQFWNSLKRGGVGLFFFAGHGLQVAGENYLVPVDARIAMEKDVQYECVNAGKVLGRMEDAGNGLNIVILDACRNNPFARSFRSADRGLAKMDAPTGSLIAFATAPGDVAADGEGKNGLYTSHLLRHLNTPGLTIENVLKRTRIGVAADSSRLGRKQTPWESSSLMGDFFFVGGGQGAGQVASLGPVAVPQAPAKPASVPQQQALAPAPKQAPPVPAAGEPRPGEVWTDPSTGMEFVWVPGGCFQMGGGEGRADEKPAHKVCLDGFWLGKTEVTQGQWLKAMGENPAFFTRAKTGSSLNMPVENVSWNDAKALASRMGTGGAGRFRLPTEAEWEYACRSGGKDERYSGAADPDLVAWHSQSVLGIGGSTRQSGLKVPNGLGLQDMSGNVWEWVEDVYDAGAYARHAGRNPVNAEGGANRVNRGGSWFNGPEALRCVRRDSNPPNFRHYTLGLRLVREPDFSSPAAAVAPQSAPQPAQQASITDQGRERLGARLSASKAAPQGGSAPVAQVQPAPEGVSGLKVRIVHTPGGTQRAREVKEMLVGQGVSVELFPFSPNGSENNFKGRLFYSQGQDANARRVAELVQPLEPMQLWFGPSNLAGGIDISLWVVR